MDAEFDKTSFLASLTHRPGVYRMLDAKGTVIYVGKAHDLKKRVSSYFGSKAHHPKTMALMEKTVDVEITVTASEKEALLLELNLIKEHQPHFNVLMRDGKGYPYIYVSTDQKYPRFSFPVLQLGRQRQRPAVEPMGLGAVHGAAQTGQPLQREHGGRAVAQPLLQFHHFAPGCFRLAPSRVLLGSCQLDQSRGQRLLGANTA